MHDSAGSRQSFYTRTARPVTVALVLALAIGCEREPPPQKAAPPVSSAICEGQKEDPAKSELRPAIDAFKAQDYATAQRLLDALMKKYPHSATVRVWRGDATLFDKALDEAQAAERALPYFTEAKRLHDAGCPLGDYGQYYMRMGLVYGYLRRDDPKPALVELEKLRASWPDSAEVTYQLARAQCSLGQLDACAQSFSATLETAKSLKRPMFLRNHNSLDDWIRRSRTQSEFPELRKDPRYEQIIRRATEGR